MRECVTAIIVVCGVCGTGAAQQIAPPPRKVDPNNQNRYTATGTVVAIGVDSITLQRDYELGYTSEPTTKCTGCRGVGIIYGKPASISIKTPDGKSHHFKATATVSVGESTTVVREDGSAVTIRKSDYPPQTFAMSAELTNGKVPAHSFGSDSYRLEDVRVGDKVGLNMHRWQDNPEQCFDITIYRRPGGRVPAGHKVNPKNPWHEDMNAWQDYEERGIPLPDRLDPVKRWDLIYWERFRPDTPMPTSIPPAVD